MKKFILLAAACMFALSGCHNHGGEHHHDHGHDHDGEAHGHHHEEVINMSAYSDNLELCAEAAPFSLNEERTVLAHFTRLSDFKPVREGSCTATLTAGGKTATQTLDAPVKDGVYRFTLTPQAAGEAVLSFELDGETLTVATVVFEDDEEGEEYAEELEIKSGNAVPFTKEKSWNVDFRTDPVEIRRVGNTIRAMALVDLPEAGETALTARSSGVVSITGGSLPEGVAVRAGAVLFSIDGNTISDDNLKVRYVEAESHYQLAKAEYERKLALAADRIVSESELQQAKHDFDSAKAVYDNIRSGYNGGRQTVKSPISGFVRSINVRNGQYVEAGQTLAVVSTSDKLCLLADVPSRYYSDIARANGANIRPVNGSQTLSLDALGGHMVSYGKSAENGLIPVHFHIKSTPDLVPGTYVEMFITTEGSREAVCVPCGAILEEMGNHFVYKQLNPECFEKTQVMTGASDGVYTEILSGLEGGERVVSKGAILVKLSQAAGALDPHAGHAH